MGDHRMKKNNKVQAKCKNTTNTQDKNVQSKKTNNTKATNNTSNKQNVGFEATDEESRSFRLDEDSEHSFELR